MDSLKDYKMIKNDNNKKNTPVRDLRHQDWLQAAFWAPELRNTLEIMYTVYATAVKKHNCPLQEDGLCSSVFIWMNEILHVRTVLESQRGGWVGQA